MAITLDLKKNALLSLPNGLFRFIKEKPHNVLLLEKEDTGLEMRLPEHMLVDMLGRGKAKVVDFFRTGEPGPEQNAEFGPGEAWIDEDKDTAKLTEEGRRALALQFYTIKWDESGDRPLGDKGLRELIAKWRPVVVQMQFESNDRNSFRVRPARLRHAAKHLGRIGERPLRVFRTRRGKSTRQRFDPIVDQKLTDAVEFYWEARAHSYTDAYAKFHTEMVEINSKRAAGDQLEFPKRLEILRRRIRKTANAVTWARKYSPSEAHRKFKGIKDGLVATYPLELTIMDDTLADVHVLDTETLLPLGRPTVTVNIDIATRMILGYLISFEPPSLYSALTTLKRANKNKNYMKTLYPEISGSWDAWGRCEELLLDNAWQYKSPSLKHSLGNLGISVIWAPVRTGQYKSIGERFFRTLNTMLFHKLKGGVPYNSYMMRQVGLDPRKDGVITLGDLDALMHETIVVYQGRKHEGLGAIPARIWRDKIAIRKRHFISDVTALDHVLGRVDTAKLTTSGIRFKEMDFHDPTITTALLDDLVQDTPVRSQSDKTYAPARVNNVVVKWNPADASSISVWNSGGKPAPHYVTLPNRDLKFFKGISFWHWEKLREFAKQQDLDFNSEANRWKARDDLRKSWEKLARKMPMRQSRDARRGLAFSQGQFDGTNVNQPIDIDPNTVIEQEAEPSTDGLNQPEGVSDELAAYLLDPKNRPAKGRTPSKRTTAKAMRTKANNKKEAEQAKEAAEARERQGNPSGNPVSDTSRKTKDPSIPKTASTAGWEEEELKDLDGADAPLAADQASSNSGWGDDFQ